MLCSHALCLLLGIGTRAWDTVVKLAQKNQVPCHGLKDETSNNMDTEIDEVMKEHFGLLVQLASPCATLVVRDMVKDGFETTLRDEEGKLMELLSHMIKGGIFNSILAEKG